MWTPSGHSTGPDECVSLPDIPHWPNWLLYAKTKYCCRQSPTVAKLIDLHIWKICLERCHWRIKLILIYLLTAIWLSPGGSSTVHIYTQEIRRTTQITTNVEECGPCPVFANFTLAFALQLRKKHGKTSVKVRETSVRIRITSARGKKNLSQD